MFILLLQIQNRLRVVLIYKKIWRRFNNRGRKKDFISVWTKSRLNLVYQFILLVWTKTLVKSADSSVHLLHRLKEGNAVARTALQNGSMWLLRFTCSMCSPRVLSHQIVGGWDPAPGSASHTVILSPEWRGEEEQEVWWRPTSLPEKDRSGVKK